MIAQYLAALLLCTLVSGQDWTCDDCTEGGAALGAFASSETAIASQADVLLAEVCPQADDPAFCAENLPGFWALLSPIIFPEHFTHICDDLEECSPPEKVTILKSFLPPQNYSYFLPRTLFPIVLPVVPV